MTSTEEQKKAANDLMRLLATENFAKGGADIKPEAQELFMNELAIRFFSREQAAADNAARVCQGGACHCIAVARYCMKDVAETIVKAVEEVAEGNEVSAVEAARSAAAPFIKGKSGVSSSSTGGVLDKESKT